MNPSADNIDRTGTGLTFSVIIPNHNGEDNLAEVLDAVFGAGESSLEVIVVDDASTDNSRRIAADYPVRWIPHRTCRGAAAARNTGASAAAGRILVFVDNDIVIPADTFRKLKAHYRDNRVEGVIGLLRPLTRYGNLCSQYKNFYMHYTYLKLPDEVTVFYTSIASIRRETFQDVGGFDPLYRSATIEDMEFGIRATAAGYKIIIDRSLQVDHIRHYTLASLLKTDFRRATGLAKMALRDRLSRKKKAGYATTSPSFLSGIVLSVISVILAAAGLIFSSPVLLLSALPAFILVAVVNMRFIAALGRLTVPGYSLSAAILIFLDMLAFGAGLIHGVLGFFAGRRY